LGDPPLTASGAAENAEVSQRDEEEERKEGVKNLSLFLSSSLCETSAFSAPLRWKGPFHH